MELISVIMSTYNENKEYITQSIKSITSQTYKNIELIVVLDNPYNQTISDTVLSLAKMDSRIKVIKNEKNIGLTASLNKALEISEGTYIARMDADDISDKYRIEKEYKYMQDNSLDIVGCETRRINEKGKVVINRANKSFSSECISKCLRYDNCVAHPTWLVRKDVYEMLNGYRELSLCEDYDFLLRCIKNGLKIGICDEVLLSYRINSNGISRTNGLKQMLSGHYLQKNFSKLENITQKDIDEYTNKKITKKYCIKYEQALRLLNGAQENIKQKNFQGVIQLLKCIMKSKFIIINIYKIFKINMIRLIYRENTFTRGVK